MSHHECSKYLELIGPNNSIEIEVVFSFTFVKGYAAHYGSLSYAGHPGEPDGIEDLDVKAIYPMVKDDRGNLKRGPSLALTQWLIDFFLSCADESEFVEEVA